YKKVVSVKVRAPVDGKVEVGRVDDGSGRPDREVVAIEGDVDVPERDLRLEQLAGQRVQAPGQDGSPPMDADDRDRPVGVLLDDLVRDPHQCAAHVIVVEDDRGGLQRAPSWPYGTGFKDPTAIVV